MLPKKLIKVWSFWVPHFLCKIGRQTSENNWEHPYPTKIFTIVLSCIAKNRRLDTMCPTSFSVSHVRGNSLCLTNSILWIREQTWKIWLSSPASPFHNFVQAPPRQIAACPRPVKSHNNFQAQDLLTGHKFGQLLGSYLTPSSSSLYVNNHSHGSPVTIAIIIMLLK